MERLNNIQLEKYSSIVLEWRSKMQAHGTDISSYSVNQTTCPCAGDPTQSRKCVHLDVALKTGKTHAYNLYADDNMTEPEIVSYLNSNFSSINGTASVFEIVVEAHLGYIGFTFAGIYKRLSGDKV